jgi:chemotaxis protein methyltransferase CheR
MTAAALRAAADPALASEQKFPFSQKNCERVRRLIHAHAGIRLHDGKHVMVYSRLARRRRETGHRSFADYLEWLQSGDTNAQAEWQQFVNGLTTNLTSFFRESHHFECVADDLRRLNRRDVRIWCSAASTGEEPYSIAMVVEETLVAAAHVEIVASDIDITVLATAERGVDDLRARGLSPERLKRHSCAAKAPTKSASACGRNWPAASASFR